MYVKICGLRDAAMTAHAAAAGANAVGVVMSPKSPRHASLAEAAAVVDAARAGGRPVETVLVTNALEAVEATRLAAELGFDALQLHGAYTGDDFRAALELFPRVWRATSLAAFPTLAAGEFGEERLLVDGARAGSGEAWDIDLVREADLGSEWVLAGGLSPTNVAAAIRAAGPWGVDVSSGVESRPGEKDPERISAFIRAARSPLELGD